jgi:DNA topoisomerase-3
LKYLVIAEKPSVSKSIAKVIGAYRQEDGYLEGGDCVVSWCLGHLAEYAAPEHYDERYENWRFEDLPILPVEWKLLVHNTKKPQFNVLRKLLRSKKFDYVVNACDAGREGEAIFRRVYALAGSKLPIKRLWISSMEDAAIQQGFENLKDGAAYDNLFAASECRAKADWLIGMNGTRAFTKKYGRKQTIGRVQTPTLAMLAERQTKIQNFVKEPYYKVELSGAGVVAVSEQMAQEQDADVMQAVCDGQCAVVGSIERKRVEKKPPKLYDLTTLQREANRYYGLTASQTLQALQELYEEKLVTYPRTDSQFVTEDMRKTMESLVLALDGAAADVSCVINNSKVTDHHAILPTMQGAKYDKEKLSETKQKILSLIIWKLVQAVQPPFIYEDVLVTVCCQGQNFTAKYKNVLQPGYTAKPVPLVEPEKNKDASLPKKLEQGMVIPVVRAEKKQGFTSPPKVYTEDTLLSAMETAGNKEFEKDTEKKGLGTPATRAAILEKLVSSGYVQRKGKQMIPTEDGVAAIRNIPDYLKSASMTAEWENDLLRMERGEIKPHDFMQSIHGLLDKMLADLRQIPTVAAAPYYNKVSVGSCPVCGNPVHESKLSFCCADRSCKFALWKESRYLSSMRKTLDKKMAVDLLKKGRTHVKDFYSAKKDKTFAADLVMRVEDGRAQYSLEFPKTPMQTKM